MQSVSSRIWTRVAVSISYDDNHYTMGIAFIRKLNFFGFLSLKSLHMTARSFALSLLVHAAYFVCPTAVGKCPTSSRWWISSDTIFLLFNVDYLDHQRCRCRPWPAFPFATVPIIYFIRRADSAFSTAIFAFHFRPVITDGWAFFTSGSRESRSIWKGHAFPNSYSSTSDTLEVLVLLMNYIVPRLLRNYVIPTIFYRFNRTVVLTFVIPHISAMVILIQELYMRSHLSKECNPLVAVFLGPANDVDQ